VTRGEKHKQRGRERNKGVMQSSASRRKTGCRLKPRQCRNISKSSKKHKRGIDDKDGEKRLKAEEGGEEGGANETPGKDLKERI